MFKEELFKNLFTIQKVQRKDSLDIGKIKLKNIIIW